MEDKEGQGRASQEHRIDREKLNGSEPYFKPEENKKWPSYIERRFAVLNSAYNLDCEEIKRLITEDKSLDQEVLWSFLARQISEVSKQKSDDSQATDQEWMLNRLFAFAESQEIGYLSRVAATEALSSFGLQALEKLKVLAKDSSSNVREAAAKSLGNFGKLSWEMLRPLTEDSYRSVRLEATKALYWTGEPPILEKLRSMVRSSNSNNRLFVAEVMAGVGKPSAEIVDILITDTDSYVLMVAARALSRLDNPDLKKLGTLAVHPEQHVHKAAIEVLAKIGLPSLETLKTIAESDKPSPESNSILNNSIRKEAINALASLGESALSSIEVLAKDCKEDIVRGEAVRALGKVGLASLETLKVLAKDPDWIIRSSVAEALFLINQPVKPVLEILNGLQRDSYQGVREKAQMTLGAFSEQQTVAKFFLSELEKNHFVRSLIVRQEPVLANPFFKDIYNPQEEEKSPILKLSDIISDLRQKYPFLIGLSVLGSFFKGYWIKSSDVDWGLIYDSTVPLEQGKVPQQMVDEFREKAKKAGFRLCVDHSLDLSEIKKQDPLNLEIAFNGLFLGDRVKLRGAQRKIMENVTFEIWKKIQRVWVATLDNYSKMFLRFQLSREQVLFIADARNFLWSLPNYEIARQEWR